MVRPLAVGWDKRVVGAVMLLFGCGPVVSEADTNGSTSHDVPGSTSATSATSITTISTATSASETGQPHSTSTTFATDDEGSSGSSGSTTAACPEEAGGGFVPPGPCEDPCYRPIPGCTECSVWQQDCPRGERCAARSSGADSAVWDRVWCVPLHPDPAEIGEPCEVEGSAYSGIDTCRANARCWNVDPETLQGTCVELCEGTPEAPTCSDPSTLCLAANEDVINVCLPQCDPLANACDSGNGCYPIPGGFVCLPLDAGLLQPEPGSCITLNECPVGTACAEEANACPDGATPCCAPYCDLNAPACPDGTSCVDALGDTSVGLCQEGG